MKKNLLLFCLTVAIFACSGLTITADQMGFNNGQSRNFRQGGWTQASTDLTSGTGKYWNFALPSPGYVNNTYTAVSGVSGWPTANILCEYSQSINGYTGSGSIYYQNTGTDILQVGYTGYPNIVWSPAIPTGLPHYPGKTWQGSHSYWNGSYSVSGEVISEGTITTHLGSFQAVCVRYYYTTAAISYYCYQWETREYGITAYSMTLNGGMLYVLYQAQQNQVNNDDQTVCQINRLKVHPNPVEQDVEIGFDLKNGGNVKLTLFNLRGQQVAEQNLGWLSAGQHSAVWTIGAELKRGTGIYLLRVLSGSTVETTRLIIR